MATGLVLLAPWVGDEGDEDRGAALPGDRLPVSGAGADARSGVDFLGEPESQWDFDPSSVLPGGRVSPMSQWYDGPPIGDATAFGEIVVVWVAPPFDAPSPDSGVLVGLDASTGDPVWRVEGSTNFPECRAVSDGSRLLCASLLTTGADDLGQGGSSPLVLIDPESGDIEVESEMRYAGTEIAVGTTDPYVFAHPEPGRMQLVALSPADLEPRWTADLDVSSVTDQYFPEVDEQPGSDELNVTAGDLRWVVDATTGEPGEAITDGATAVDDGYRIVADYDAGSTVVTDRSGFAVLTATGEPWWDEDRQRVRDGRIGIGDTLWDLTTGEAVWSAGSAADYHHVVADGRFVRASGVGAPLLLDASTGEPVFGTGGTTGQTYGEWFGDDVMLAIGEDGTARAYDLEGDVRWERQVGDLLPENADSDYFVSAEPVSTPSALVVAGRAGVRGFTGFPADADGSAVVGAARGGDTATDYVTACGTEPELTPVEAVAADGGIRVTYTATATCPEGQWLAFGDQRVDMSVDGSPYLSGAFDFAAEPRWVPAEGTPLDLVYPPGSAFATPEEINDAIDEDDGTGEIVQVACERGDDAVAGVVPADPTAAAPGTDPVSSTGPTDETDQTESALETLRRISAADAPHLDAEVAGSWVPQLSSKNSGLVADGIVWDAEAILAEHLRLRLRYPGVRLAWSTDWNSYQLDGFWVTLVAGSPTSGPESALDFCAAQAFDRDHCYAKQLDRDGSWEDRTRMLPE